MIVTGAGGQLGSEVCRLSTHETYGTYLGERPHSGKAKLVQMDITDAAAVSKVFSSVKPDVVVHCAAMTNVDSCETQKDIAWDVNVDGTKNIVRACGKSGASLVYISTDYVFDGKKGNYAETDVPNPLNHYARTKLAGEMLASTLGRHMILRSSVMFSSGGNNFVSWVRGSLLKGKTMIVTDQVNSPTLATEMAEAVLRLVELDATGVYHTAGAERISRYDFAKKIAMAFGFDEKLIVPIKTDELHQKAVRPRDSSLDIAKVKKVGIAFSNADGALEKLKGMKEAL
jgi:dTDP-4-dehydrorhamnose reductase